MNILLQAVWNYYTKNNNIQGYNIGLNVCDLEKSLEYVVKTNDAATSKKVDIFHGRVIYDKSRQIEEIKKVINYFAKYFQEHNECRRPLLYFVLLKIIVLGRFFKRKEFEAENEYRITKIERIECFTLEKKRKTVEFRIKDGYFIPYIPLKFDLNAIKTFIISPTINRKLATKGLQAMLYNARLCPQIKYSEIPVRY